MTVAVVHTRVDKNRAQHRSGQRRLFDEVRMIGRDCPLCDGVGHREGRACPNCEGSGRAVIPFE